MKLTKLILLTFISSIFFSCSSEDDKNTTAQDLIGTWKLREASVGYSNLNNYEITYSCGDLETETCIENSNNLFTIYPNQTGILNFTTGFQPVLESSQNNQEEYICSLDCTQINENDSFFITTGLAHVNNNEGELVGEIAMPEAFRVVDSNGSILYTGTLSLNGVLFLFPYDNPTDSQTIDIDGEQVEVYESILYIYEKQ